jgi:arylsulfatase A-like enzyme
MITGTYPDAHYGHRAEDYSTDVLADLSVNFVLEAPADQPIFLYFSPYGAHAGFDPAPRHEDTWPLPTSLSPAVNADEQGIPDWRRNLPDVDEMYIKKLVKHQHEVMMSVDEAIERIIHALEATDRMQDTLVVFTSDNGLQRGQHRLMGKYVPYQASTHLPVVLRWDGHYTPNTSSNRVTTSMDIHATICKAAGVQLPYSGTPLSRPCTGTLLEGGPDLHGDYRPSYIGWRTSRYLWVEWADGFEEFFDYKADPHELLNMIDEPKYADEIAELREFAHTAANPKPPGWNSI